MKYKESTLEQVSPKELRKLKSGFQASRCNHSTEKSYQLLLSPPP